MIETLPEAPALADLRPPPEVAAAFAAFRAELTGRSQIVWGEHCSECAYPACYAHCAFYTPRVDFHCRRFEAGFEPLTADPALHRVRFRKWGKLEGRGPSALRPVQTAERRDVLDRRVSALIASAPAPHAVKRNLARRWDTRKAAKIAGPTADAFVVEAWASDGARRAFTLTILNTGDHGGRLFQARFDVDATYRRLTVPTADIARQVDLHAPFLVQIEPLGEAQGVQAVFGVCDFVTLAAPVAVATSVPTTQKPAKVVVWDLDETLWTGVLAEDGAQGVRLRPEAVAAIKTLDERGVLQSVASKNNAPEALAALEAFGLADYFLHPQIHWDPKSGSIAALARALNLGVDSFVFIDDQPFERAEVEAAHPGVRTLSHTQVESLTTHPWFDLPTTAESRRRRALYRQEAQRVEAFEAAGADYAGFLRASTISLLVERLTSGDLERVFELSQRTNQLNFTGRKYARDQVKALLSAQTGETALVLRCSDRFGDYGLIGFAVVNRDAGLVSDLFLSCRVQRKRMEHAFIAWLARDLAARGVETMRIAYAATGRNGAALEMLESLGFSAGPEAGIWSRQTDATIAESDIVAVSAPAAAKAA